MRVGRRGPGALLAVAALAAVAVALREPIGGAVRELLEWSAGLGPWTGAALVAAWVPAAVLLVPGSLLTLGTGFLLGLGWGTVAVSAGSTAGAAAAFAVGRGLLRERIRRRMTGDRRFHAIDRAVEEDGFRVTFLLRLSPLFPYNLTNYVFGVTGVRFRDYLLASWLGMLPATVLYVWLGAGARTLAEASAGGGGGGPARTALFVLGLVATALVVAVVTRRARAALARREELADVVSDDA